MSAPSVESLYSIDADGELAWSAAAGDIQASVAVADEMAIVVSGTDGSDFSVQAFELDSGEDRWTVELGDGNFPAQLMIAGEAVVVLSEGPSNQALEAFDPATGESIWRRDLLGRSSTGAVEADGLLLFADARGDQVTALEPATGEERWTQSVEGVSGKAPVVTEGRVLVDSLTEIHALDVESGEVAWSVPTSGDVDSVVTLSDAIGAISFEQGSQPDMILEVFEARTGSQLWSFTNPNISVPPSTPATEGEVLVLTAPDRGIVKTCGWAGPVDHAAAS